MINVLVRATGNKHVWPWPPGDFLICSQNTITLLSCLSSIHETISPSAFLNSNPALLTSSISDLFLHQGQPVILVDCLRLYLHLAAFPQFISSSFFFFFLSFTISLPQHLFVIRNCLPQHDQHMQLTFLSIYLSCFSLPTESIFFLPSMSDFSFFLQSQPTYINHYIVFCFASLILPCPPC